MRAHKSNVDDLAIMINLHDKPVFIAANIEDRPIVSKNTRVPVMPFHVSRASPIGSSSFSKPRF